ncbi:MAG: GntR family transcriptional regulator, partial [Desulfobacterales bacterium]|nr:GntR family transcriptional regulator [Desulfobacterales bacterium]
MLNSNSPIPLYHQLAEILIGRIRSGEYPPGTRIPSEHALAASHGIGRPTVRQAIDRLVRKRMLLKKRGSGTYVRVEEEEVDLFSIAGTTSAFHKKGISVATTILEKTHLTSFFRDPENPFTGRSAYF